jgi:hypothetical protein
MHGCGHHDDRACSADRANAGDRPRHRALALCFVVDATALRSVPQDEHPRCGRDVEQYVGRPADFEQPSDPVRRAGLQERCVNQAFDPRDVILRPLM